MARSSRHVPIRTCIVCGGKAPKPDLLRLVADSPGSVVVDLSGRLAGRGAYVCRGAGCRSEDLKKGRLENALRAKVGREALSRLQSALRMARAEDQGPHPDEAAGDGGHY